MRRSLAISIILALDLLFALSVHAVPPDMALVPGGMHRPFYGGKKTTKKVHSFYLDIFPVTHKAFAPFLEAHPEWLRAHASPLFVDEHYLEHEKRAAPPDPASPITNISWFTARAFCRAQGKRLPTLDEWEFAADDPSFSTQRILEWYGKPTPERLSPVGQAGLRRAEAASAAQAGKNRNGVADLHGLIWEWVEDFNAVPITSESRGDKALDRNLFCGAGAFGSGDPKNYAAFMRYAFRASLKASYAIANLGFRCAKDME